MRLLVLCQDPDGPVVRHRIRAILPHLAEAGFHDVRIVGVPKQILARQRLLRSAGDFDLVLVVRKLFAGIDIVPLGLASRKLAYDFDDAVMLRDPFQRRGRSRTREARFARMMALVNLVLAGNAHLVGLAEEHAGMRQPVVIAPTPIDTERYVPSAVAPDRVRRIGWIGSRSTLPYLQLIAKPLGRLLEARSDVRFCVMADAAPELPFEVDLTPWSEEVEVPWLQALSAGVMPLSDDPWSRGKCGFKLLQYMACGVPAVASPVGANVGIADDGDAALLADGDEPWHDALTGVLDDSELAAGLARRGRAHVEKRYAAAVLGPRYARALADCARGERQ